MIVSETSFQHLEQYGTQRGKEEETREIKGRKKRENCRGRERDGRDDREKMEEAERQRDGDRTERGICH